MANPKPGQCPVIWSDTRGSVIVLVRARPGAKQDKVGPVENGYLRVAVRERPEKGKANKAIARLLARTLGVAPSCVELLRGEASREKSFAVHGIHLETAIQALREAGVALD